MIGHHWTQHAIHASRALILLRTSIAPAGFGISRRWFPIHGAARTYLLIVHFVVFSPLSRYAGSAVLPKLNRRKQLQGAAPLTQRSAALGETNLSCNAVSFCARPPPGYCQTMQRALFSQCKSCYARALLTSITAIVLCLLFARVCSLPFICNCVSLLSRVRDFIRLFVVVCTFPVPLFGIW